MSTADDQTLQPPASRTDDDQERRFTADRPTATGQAPAAAAARPGPPDARPRGDDLGLDVGHLKVDELTLELQADLGIQRVDVAAKGVDAELHLRASLDNVVALAESTARRAPSIVEGVAHARHDAGRGRAPSSSPGDRARQLVGSPAGAATVAVAGAAVGALAGSKAGGAHGLVDHLPGRRHRRPAVARLAERAAEASGDALRSVRERLA